MDKKISKVELLLTEILDEKDSIDKTLNFFVDEVKKRLSLRKSPDKRKLQNLLNCELKLLQKLSQVTFELESLIDDELPIEELESGSDLDSAGKCCTESVVNSVGVESVQDVEPEPSISLSVSQDFPATPVHDNDSGSDITTLRENVKKFTEKIGLYGKLGEYSDFYQKNKTAEKEVMIAEKDCGASASLTLNGATNGIDDSTDYESTTSYTIQDETASTTSSSNQILNNKSSNSQPIAKSLKTSHVIKNNLKKKKKKGKNRDDCQYVLTEKNGPKEGDLCAFSHIESPSEFYVHVVDDYAGHIDKISDDIKQSVNSQSPFKSKEDAHRCIGRFCSAFLTKEQEWYRAEVLSWNLSGKSDLVEIKLCDFGNKNLVSYKNLRRLNEDLATIPQLAVKCYLPYMYPPGSTHANRLKDWPLETLTTFTELSGLFGNNALETNLFCVVYSQKIADSVAIDLSQVEYSDNSNDKTVGQILLDLGMAVQLLENLDETNLEMEQFLEDAGTYGTADNINEALVGYDARDEARICRFTKPDGTCYKGKNCKLEHVPFSRGGFTTDTVTVFREAFYDLVLPTLGSKVLILITGSIKTLTDFYVQLVSEPVVHGKYAMDQHLYDLLKKLNNPKIVEKYEKFKIWPAIGEVCLAYHWSDKWLRGVVRTVRKNDEKSILQSEVEVFMVDFGDIIYTTVNNLRQIKEEFLHLPFQAFHCYLGDYKLRANVDDKKAKAFFEQSILFQNFWAVTKSSSLPLKLSILTIKEEDIGLTLVEKGFLEKCSEDTVPDGERVPE